jgi:hypothetical protein
VTRTWQSRRSERSPSKAYSENPSPYSRGSSEGGLRGRSKRRRWRLGSFTRSATDAPRLQERDRQLVPGLADKALPRPSERWSSRTI